jgi:hypothetical protein
MLGTTLASLASVAASATLTTAIVTSDGAALRADARESAPPQALLAAGEMLEIRGERRDYLQVWDHRRERGGYVRASQVRRTALADTEAADILAVLRHVQDAPGSESLAIGMAAAWVKAAPPAALRGPAAAQAFDALGSAAQRLAQRADANATAPESGTAGAASARRSDSRLPAQLDLAAHYGVRFTTHELADGRPQVCYDGEAFRRVLALPSTPEQQARAALALTRPECTDARLPLAARSQLDAWRLGVLDGVDMAGLAPVLRNRMLLRQATLWSSLAWQQARSPGGSAPAAGSAEPAPAPGGAVAAAPAQGRPVAGVAAAQQAGQRAIDALAGVNRAELADEDGAAYNEAAMRVGAVRWAALGGDAVPAEVAAPRGARTAPRLEVAARGDATCVRVLAPLASQGSAAAAADPAPVLLERCTASRVWAASARRNAEGTAFAVAVQPAEGWRELWLLHRESGGWQVSVLPPAALAPGLGYAEFAGWLPGGRQVLVAREARAEGRYRRSFEVLRVADLATQHQAGDPTQLAAFQRWQDAGWKRMTVSVR